MKPSSSIKTKQVLGLAFATAAMALPSVQFARAEAAPEKGIVAYKFLKYEDSQPGIDRMHISASSFRAMTPIAGKWAFDMTGTYDSVSGASPHSHTDGISGASSGIRRAIDLSVTRYFNSGSITLGNSYSYETDYISRGVSLQGSLLTPSKNTTFTLGGSITTDSIEPTNHRVLDILGYTNVERKKTYAWLVGVTQVLSKDDIVQLNVGRSNATGFFTDPYKSDDDRPSYRNNTTVMTKWNHYFESTEGSSRLTYRYYSDTFGIRAHTMSAEYVQPLRYDFTVAPMVRYHSQSAADFYIPVGEPIPPTGYITTDQRLSAFGALTLGIKVSKKVADAWLLDVRYDHYMQRSNWALNGKGDSGLEHFNAEFLQLGISREF